MNRTDNLESKRVSKLYDSLEEANDEVERLTRELNQSDWYLQNISNYFDWRDKGATIRDTMRFIRTKIEAWKYFQKK